jgi:hypothetical protein
LILSQDQTLMLNLLFPFPDARLTPNPEYSRPTH